MFIAHCPICSFPIKCKDEYAFYTLGLCPKCGFDFLSNRCSNPDCRKKLRHNTSFCPMCGYESTFYLNAYDVYPLFIDDEE